MKKCHPNSKTKLPELPPIKAKPKPNCHCGYCPCGKESDSDDDDLGLDAADSDSHSMIRRNMQQIRVMSKRVRKMRRAVCAAEMARGIPGSSKKPPKKKKKPRKKSSLLDLIPDKECACEIMARAVANSVHRHIGLHDQRANINADLREPDPPIEETEEPKPA